MKNLSCVDYVTTTTELFANEIRKINKNVFVLPNAINPEEPQFTEKTKPSDRLRFGWLGGSSHLHDLKLLDGTTNRLTEFKNDYQMYLCGFDIRGNVTEINRETGEEKKETY